MPCVRCRFYSESGDPLGGGCRRKGAGCNFVHPDEPDWVNARVSTSTFRPRDRGGGGLGGSKPWGERGNRGSAASATDTGGGRNTGWNTGSGGWDTGGSTSTLNQEPSQSGNSSAANSWNTSTFTTGWNQADTARTASGNTKSNKGGGWGKGADASTESGRGRSGNAGWGASGWGDEGKTTGSAWGGSWGGTKEAGDTAGSGWGGSGGGTKGSGDTTGSGRGGTKDTDSTTRSGWGATHDTGNSAGSGWGGAQDAGDTTGSRWGATQGTENTAGSGWGGTKDAENTAGSGWGATQDTGNTAGSGWGGTKDAGNTTGSGWGGTQGGEWGASWGDSKNATNSDAMIVDSQAERESRQNGAKSKVVPAPPRIRIPDNDSKKKITGTNNEPLSLSRWGSNLPPTSTFVAVSTPVAASTPTDSTRVKRKRDAVVDDKLDVFREYIKTWERGVRAQFLLTEAEAKRDRWFRTQKSLCYTRIGAAGREKLDGQRTECDKEVNLQREKLSGAITSLTKCHDTISSQLDLGQRYNIGEQAKAFVVESKAFIDEVRTLLVAHVLRDKDNGQSGDTQAHISEADFISVDSLRSRVQDLEERFDQAQTELTLRHRRDIRSEIDEILTTKIARLRLARQREVDRVVSQPLVIPPRALENIERTAQQVMELDAKIPPTVVGIRDLLLRVDAATKRVSQLEEELIVNKQAYEKMQKTAAEKEENERRVDERLVQIRAQFEQLVASLPPDSAASLNTENSREKLTESLRPAFEANLNKFYEREVRPTVDSMQQAVIAESDRHHQEAIKVLWGKIQPAMNMVAGVSRWLDSQELGLTASVDG